jgi:hypothetical protein
LVITTIGAPVAVAIILMRITGYSGYDYEEITAIVVGCTPLVHAVVESQIHLRLIKRHLLQKEKRRLFVKRCQKEK